MSNSQSTVQRTWRGFIEAFLDQLIGCCSVDFAAFIDVSLGRERYVFSSSGKSLPDINWHNFIGTLLALQKTQPGYILIDADNLDPEFSSLEISRCFKSGEFGTVICTPILVDSDLKGIACLFKIERISADPAGLEKIKTRVEGLARMTSLLIQSLAEASSNGKDNNLHHEALQRFPDGLLMADRDGIVIETNTAFTNLTGIPPEYLVGRNLKDSSILGTDCDYLVAKLLDGGQSFEVITRISPDSEDTQGMLPDELPLDGKYLRLRGTSYPGDGSETSGMILLADDVTRDVFAKRDAYRKEYRHSQEIELATRLQLKFFPPTYQKKRIRITTKLLAARELAGDFFDIFELGPNTIGIVLGDVVGKGIPGSLMAMSVHGMIANQAGALTPPMKVLERVNEGLYHQVKGEYWYATCFYAKLHTTQLRMTYSRAGHELPLWFHNDTGDVTFLEGDGLPLGIFNDSRYVTKQIDLSEGDRLLLYTDGLTDAINQAGERFGHERLVEVFRKNCKLSSKNFIKVLENVIRDFHQEREQQDDIAIALVSIVPDSWTSLTIPPYSFSEIIENLIDELSLKGVDDDTQFKIRLSVDECVTNAFRHGHEGDERRPINVSYLVESDRIIVKVRDQGPGFDFGLIPDPTLMENLMYPGGRGVYLTMKLMDEISFNDVGNEATMVKYLFSDKS